METKDIEARLAALSPEKRALLQARMDALERTRRHGHAIPRIDDRAHLPLSFSQERIWLHQQLVPGSIVYHRPANIGLRGPLRVDPLRQAIRALVARHESLRTTVEMIADVPSLVIHPQIEVEMPVTDLSGQDDREARARRLAQEEACRPFDLDQGPMLRSHLLRLDAEDHLLLLTFHHFTFDAWSMAVLLEQLAQTYAACVTSTESTAEAAFIQYPDFAAWDRSNERITALQAGREYWRRQLADPPSLQLPTDFPRSPTPSEAAGHVEIHLPAAVVNRLRILAASEQTTLFAVLLAAFNTLLQRYTGQDDFVVGCPVAGRSRVETEPLIGVFVNTLPFRAKPDPGDSFRQLLHRVGSHVVAGLEFQEVPLQFVVQDALSDRDISGSPLFQAMFIHERLPLQPRTAGSVIFASEDSPAPATMVDLSLELMESAAGVSGYLNYRDALWRQSTVQRMAGHFLTLLEGIIADPDRRISELPLLTEAERHQLLVEWNDTAVDFPDDKCVHELFEEQVERTPDAVAVVFEDQQLTYRQLNERANQLTHFLRGRGVGPQTLVGLCLDRSIELMVGVLGILKTGGAYVPLDPALPRERRQFMLEDSRPSAVVTMNSFLDAAETSKTLLVVRLDSDSSQIASQPTSNIAIDVDPRDPAYLIYTSGSTGSPKGVVGLHRGATNRLCWMWETYPFEPHDVCSQKTTLSFVDSVCEMFGPLLQGVPSILLPDSVVKDPRRLVDILAERRITRIVLVPSLLKTLLEMHPHLDTRLPRLTHWVSSGEQLDAKVLERFRAGSSCDAHQFVRLLGGFGGRHVLRYAGSLRRRSDSHRASNQQHTGLRIGPAAEPAADRCAGRTLHWRGRPGTGISEPTGTDGGKVCSRRVLG